MGSSGEDPNKGIDASAGGLVWVRRRNGSWWPGKILSPDELPEGCVPTPRSGTPVKLLGREDASVDWYNLEKSKRVKAFHCGEYEDCIKKAKESTSHLSKKGVKYARREDAILHALELENAARLGKDHPGLSSTPDGTHHSINQSPPESNPSQESQDLDDNLNSTKDDDDGGDDDDEEGSDLDGAHEPSQSGLSFEEESKHSKTPNDSEEDGAEGVKRMKGLEDIGMGVALSKSPVKRKRSQVGHVHEFLKKKNKRRTLTKVLECTMMVSIPVVSEPVVSDSKVSELESNESKNANSAVVNNNKSDSNESKNAHSASDACKQKDSEISSLEGDNNDDDSLQKLFDVPLIAQEKNSADASNKAQVGGGAQSSQSSHIETISLVHEEQNESGSTSSGTANVHHMWQLKGKRNSRSRKLDPTHEPETQGPGGAHRGPSSTTAVDPRAPQRLLPYRQSRFTVNPKYDDSDFSLRHHMTGSGLYDVALEVKTQYRPQHVPYISLMSKSKGRPIIGHPLAVEVLEDGFCDDNDLISSMSECYSSSSELELSERKSRGRRPSKINPFPIRGPSSKSPKMKKNGFLSKKIRKLSSLTGSHRLSREERKKPVVEKLKGPSIACVPLNVVFSRINAALNGSVRR